MKLDLNLILDYFDLTDICKWSVCEDVIVYKLKEITSIKSNRYKA